MPSRELPARPSLDHLKHEAKTLHKAFAQGDAGARRRALDAIGETAALKLTDAQRVIAREYGFSTWAEVREHVRATAGVDEAISEFLAAVQQQNRDRATRVLRAQPRIADESIHIAATLGLTENARRLIAEDPSRVSRKAGDPAAEPLLYLGFSPFHGESAERDAGLLATARVLLEAGADPNAKDGHYGVPVLFAVTGMRNVLAIATLLLDAGANPTDGESIFHAAEKFHLDAMELLLARGAQLNARGEWGNTPLYFLVRWHDLEREPTVKKGVVWLLEHGADPNVLCGREAQNALHAAAGRGQHRNTVWLLLEHGADVNAPTGDGSTAWLLARRGGFDEIAALLEQAGATTSPLSRADELIAACGRGDVDAARRLTSQELIAALSPFDRVRLPEAAAAHRDQTVVACVAAGFPIDATDGMGATALHHVAIRGQVALVRALLAAGASADIRDREHASTPMGWATFGADEVSDRDGDYAATVRALLDAGTRLGPGEYMPRHAGVRAVLRQFEAG
jgi:ankyrin repeat protein